MPAFDILRRLERAERTESSAAFGVANELVSLELRRTRLAATLHSVRTAAATYPRRLPEPGVTADAWAAAENARADVLRQVRRQVRESGVDAGQFGEALALASAPSGSDFVQAIAAAEGNLARCEAEIAELEAERSRRGRRLGELRQSIQQGRRWLETHGFSVEAQ